jgi:methyl-accepting chemotaxis protein
MDRNTIELRDRIIETLRGFVLETEKVFLGLGETFPKLMEEMERSLNRSEAKIANLGTGESGESSVGKLVEETRGTLENSASRLAAMHEEDEAFYRQLREAIENLSSLEELISAIRHDSEDMELISLNAMTVALKAGSAGRAFSYITEELKRLSARTIELSDEITQRGQQLLTEFNEFSDIIEEVRSFENELFTRLREELFGSFEKLQTATRKLTDGLRGLQDQSSSIREPVRSIMESVQLQDIIRQSVDHVIISLEGLKETEGTGSVEERLDELAFVEMVPDLCNKVLEDVKEQLQGSLTRLRGHIGEAKELTDGFEERRQEYLRETGDPEIVGGMAAQRKGALHLLERVLTDIDQMMELKERISRRSGQLMRDINQLEGDFKSFSTLINRFHSIDIASRIEVAKQEVLRQMSDTVGEMTKLTRKIEHDVETSLTSTQGFIENVSSSVEHFRGLFNEEEAIVLAFRNEIQNRYERLNAEFEEIAEFVNGFSLFTNRFFDLFRESEAELSRLEDLGKQIDEIEEELGRVREIAREQKQPLLDELGLESWEIKSERLQSMIDRFTIFTHKESAGALAGIEVETGATSGELTLF